jgi:uncharacterized Ntn-hydrolase superfamily protein
MRKAWSRKESSFGCLLIIFAFVVLAPALLWAEPPESFQQKWDHTFSIVAIDPDTGHLGVAVSTARLAVGNRVPFVKAKVGAVATQANTNPTLAYEALLFLEMGKTAQEALDAALGSDAGREERQLTIIDAKGNKAAFTGTKPDDYKGHIIGKNCVVAGNILVGPETLSAMVEAFDRTEGHLSDRIMAAMEAGQKAGGDKRGKISAAILVATEGLHPYVNLRVDNSTDPVAELRKLYDAYKAAFLTPKK